MSIDQVLAVVAVRDIDAAAAWYGSLFGRQPDNKPMDTLVEWNIVGSGWLQVTVDPDRAGTSLFNLGVSELSDLVESLTLLGLQPGPVQDVKKGVQLCALADPDGNAITLIGNFRPVY